MKERLSFFLWFFSVLGLIISNYCCLGVESKQSLNNIKSRILPKLSEETKNNIEAIEDICMEKLIEKSTKNPLSNLELVLKLIRDQIMEVERIIYTFLGGRIRYIYRSINNDIIGKQLNIKRKELLIKLLLDKIEDKQDIVTITVEDINKLIEDWTRSSVDYVITDLNLHVDKKVQNLLREKIQRAKIIQITDSKEKIQKEINKLQEEEKVLKEKINLFPKERALLINQIKLGSTLEERINLNKKIEELNILENRTMSLFFVVLDRLWPIKIQKGLEIKKEEIGKIIECLQYQIQLIGYVKFHGTDQIYISEEIDFPQFLDLPTSVNLQNEKQTDAKC